MRPRLLLPALAALLLTLSGCGLGPGGEPDERSLTVLAAASLTETFTRLGDTFEAAHPDVEVRLAFDSSATLAQQVTEGAPADVLATADQRSMSLAQDAGGVADSPRLLARNTLVLITPAGDPAVDDVTDLEDPDVDFVTCVPTAPCGALAAEVLSRNDVAAAPASQEVDVKAVLARVTSGEADAGLVYRSDAVAAGDGIEVVQLPGGASRPTDYLVAVLAGAQEPDLAREFLELALGPEGRRVLTEAGFTDPGSEPDR
ncbi:molybdate ABC transporter substrate-binding protein [Nocardioides houyundeii]|uniref:molybdate ABC transporter substrate-binding protein n=1 Tax=Nocardioides houyundeii TaxID=2045452 RepID=UPI0018F043D7|nr:molybdate ABC transporter substrate-binding protein [Nocardioides houyundeii]